MCERNATKQKAEGYDLAGTSLNQRHTGPSTALSEVEAYTYSVPQRGVASTLARVVVSGRTISTTTRASVEATPLCGTL